MVSDTRNSPNRMYITDTNCGPETNGTDVAISDFTTVESPMTVRDCLGKGAPNSTVKVGIVHTWRGDLIVDLVAPDGSVYNLLNRVVGVGDIHQTFTLDLSGEPVNGVW